MRSKGFSGKTDHLAPSLVNSMKGSLRKRIAEQMEKAEPEHNEQLERIELKKITKIKKKAH